MLAEVCAAVEIAVEWLVADNSDSARRVIERFPAVRDNCDRLKFNDPAEALAYLVLHTPDRYSRMFQVLERLLVDGRLPLGKRNDFAAIDVGAGPGPGIFAVRNFYAALACYARLHDPTWPVTPLGRADVVEYSQAMPQVMRRFAEALVQVEQGRLGRARDNLTEPQPYAEELARSAAPLSAVYRDFSVLDIHKEHHEARRRRAEELYWDDELALSREGARRLAYEETADRPSGYALAAIMNFLTPGSDALPRFSEAFDRLMRGALVPGGTMLVLGAGNPEYQAIYEELDQRADDARLTIVDGFDKALKAGHRADERAAIRALTRGVWNQLESLAGDVNQTKDELVALGAAGIFDKQERYRFPLFRVRGLPSRAVGSVWKLEWLPLA